jgi:capsular polysaccharide biosynthesis protein
MALEDISADVAAIACPESRVFTYPTRLADAWQPGVQQVVESAGVLDAARFRFEVKQGSTASLNIPPWTRNPLRRLRRKGAPLELRDKIVLDYRFETPGNYSHVIINMAQHALLFRKALRERGEADRELVMLIRPHPPRFATDVFELLGIPWLATDAEVLGPIAHLTIESTRKSNFLFVPELFPEITAEGPSPERLFIGRRSTRGLVNEEEVSTYVKKEGFEVCSFEGMPVRNQWALVRRAKHIIAIHGAGLANLIFNRAWTEGSGNGPRVVEIFPGGFKVTYFRYLVHALQGRWCAVRAQVTPETLRDLDERGRPLSHAYEPIRVHVDSIRAALDYLR